MKNILFLMRYPIDQEYNLKGKFNGQMLACKSLGYEVYYLSYNTEAFNICSYNNGCTKVVYSTHFGRIKNYRSTVAFFDLYSALKKVLRTYSFDYIYMRSKLVTKTAIEAIQIFKEKGGKLIVEIPSYGVEEKSLGITRNFAKRLAQWSQTRFDELVDFYTLIGNDCPDNYRGKPAISISNGVTVELFPAKQWGKIGNEIHILALASMRDWQGYDRAIKGMKEYNGSESLIMHLVGTDFDGSVEKWMQLSEDLNLKGSVIYEGPLYEDKLDKMFDLCQVAIATLGMHRKGSPYASTLKLREYTARGIPFIYGYEDPGLTGDEWFAKKVAADDSNIDFNDIIPWLRNIYSSYYSNEMIRQYADNDLSWKTQFEKIFMEVE